IRANIEALDASFRQLLRYGDQFVHGRGRLNARLLQQALAVVDHTHIIDHLDRIDLTVDSEGFERDGIEIAFDARDNIVKRFDQSSLDLVNGGVRQFKYIGGIGTEQSRAQFVGVFIPCAWYPAHSHVGFCVLFGVAEYRLVSASLTILVIPLLERGETGVATGATGSCTS